MHSSTVFEFFRDSFAWTWLYCISFSSQHETLVVVYFQQKVVQKISVMPPQLSENFSDPSSFHFFVCLFGIGGCKRWEWKKIRGGYAKETLSSIFCSPFLFLFLYSGIYSFESRFPCMRVFIFIWFNHILYAFFFFSPNSLFFLSIY